MRREAVDSLTNVKVRLAVKEKGPGVVAFPFSRRLDVCDGRAALTTDLGELEFDVVGGRLLWSVLVLRDGEIRHHEDRGRA